MGMSTHAVGFVPPDEQWEKMRQVYRACRDAGVNPPDEVTDFFGDSDPEGPGAEVDLGEAMCRWSDDYRQGLEVDLSELDPKVRLIRFYNSW